MGQAARRGRPRKAGARTAKGRLIVPVDRGNAMVQARTARFAGFQGGKADQQVGDQIGRAWAVGLLDGHAFDAAILRDIGRTYASLYWHEYAALAPKMASLERRQRSVANDCWDDKAGARFNTLDTLVRKAGHRAATALEDLTVNGWWFPDDDKPWVARLIRSAIAANGEGADGESAMANDRARLAAACAALLRMAEGR